MSERRNTVRTVRRHQKSGRPKRSVHPAAIAAECRLRIGTHRLQPDLRPVPKCRNTGEEFTDRRTAWALVRLPRHGRPLIGEQRDHGAHIGGLEGPRETLAEPALAGRLRDRPRMPAHVATQTFPSALQRGLRGHRSKPGHAGHLRSTEPEHVPQDEHGGLARGKLVQQFDDGQFERGTRAQHLPPSSSTGCRSKQHAGATTVK